MNSDSCRVHAFLLGNIGLGVLVFAIATYFIITGEYTSLAERNSAEALLNTFSLGGLIYAAVILIVDVMSRPFLCASRAE